MPVPIPDPSDGLGRDRPFATADQKAALVSGQPFVLIDSREELAEQNQLAFLVQLLDHNLRPVGDTFVRTWAPGPHRLKLMQLVREAAAADDVAGPCQVKLIESTDPGRSPYQLIGPYHRESAGVAVADDDHVAV